MEIKEPVVFAYTNTSAALARLRVKSGAIISAFECATASVLTASEVTLEFLLLNSDAMLAPTFAITKWASPLYLEKLALMPPALGLPVLALEAISGVVPLPAGFSLELMVTSSAVTSMFRTPAVCCVLTFATATLTAILVTATLSAGAPISACALAVVVASIVRSESTRFSLPAVLFCACASA